MDDSVGVDDTLYFYSAEDAYGEFSQWYMSRFVDDQGVEYTCCEQYMMHRKALLMGDEETAALILAAAHPAEMKKLGRKVRPWDEEKWVRERLSLVTEGNFFKFSSSKALKETLLGTGTRRLAEAAPNDRIWGIGLSTKAAAAGTPWRGLNLLGRALEAVRERLGDAAFPVAPHATLGKVRLALDCGGVLSEIDTDSETDVVESVLRNAPTAECVAAVRKLVDALGPENVFILSKCKARVRHATAAFLSKRGPGDGLNFYEATGLLPRNVIFCGLRKGGSAQGLRFKPIDAVLHNCPFEPGPRRADPDDVGKGPVASKLRLTHLVDDRLDCLASFWHQGHVTTEPRGVLLFGAIAPPASSFPVTSCRRGWTDVLAFFFPPAAGGGAAPQEEEDAPPPTSRSRKQRSRKQRAGGVVQSGQWN